MKVIVAISGASGALYAIRLIEVLSENTEITLVASETAKKIIAEESDYSFEDLENLADEVFENHDMEAGICSGS
ncbi:MAG: flavoprotein, partial [Thermoplasmata archaeon]|nr:flavoprotein [Thermoplasmata archaeon]